MALNFYPHDDDMNISSLKDRLEVLAEAAERYKAATLDPSSAIITDELDEQGKKKGLVPRNIVIAYNWQELARALREVRELPENNTPNKAIKGDRLARLAEIYEVLRSAKMPKLESVRLTLVSETAQIRGALGP